MKWNCTNHRYVFVIFVLPIQLAWWAEFNKTYSAFVFVLFEIMLVKLASNSHDLIVISITLSSYRQEKEQWLPPTMPIFPKAHWNQKRHNERDEHFLVRNRTHTQFLCVWSQNTLHCNTANPIRIQPCLPSFSYYHTAQLRTE